MESPIRRNQQKLTGMRRRAVLASIGTGTAALSSGCLDVLQGASNSHPQLGWVAVNNYHPEPQRFEIEIRREDTVVHESSHEIDGKPETRIPGDVLECTWGAEPGPYVLRGRVGDSEWVERSIGQVIENSSEMTETTECVIAEGAYARYGSEEFGWLVQDWCDDVSSYDGGCAFANSES